MLISPDKLPNMSSSLGFIIRDGVETDVANCLTLDHRYETDYVWQMNVDEQSDLWQIRFNKQHLPRTLETTYIPDERRIRLMLSPEQCFLVAVAKEGNEILGYLTMDNDAIYRTGRIQDIVVSLPYRRHRIATRLVNIARQWAREHGINQLTAENYTQNYPGIVFLQQIGFKFCGYSDQYFPNHDIAIFFSQTLR